MIKSIEFAGKIIPADRCISLTMEAGTGEIVCNEDSGIKGVEKEVTYRFNVNRFPVKVNYSGD